MHSRIFQISKNPITEDQLLTEDRYIDDGFVGRIADYVSEQMDVEDDLNWLINCQKGIELIKEDDTFKIKIVSKKDYFEKSFEEFQNLVKKFNDYTLDEFIDSKNWFDFYQMKSCYDDKYAFYFDDSDDYFGITTLDDFVRNVEEGSIYYIGKTFDYHY